MFDTFASTDENGNHIVRQGFNSSVLKSYFNIKSLFVKSDNLKLSLSELPNWLKEFKKENKGRKYCISLGKVTAADIQLLHPELITEQNIDIKSEDGFVIHLAYDDSDMLMKKWGDKFQQTELVKQSIEYFTDDGIPCFVIDCGDSYEKLVQSIRIINDEVIESKKFKFEIDFWFY